MKHLYIGIAVTVMAVSCPGSSVPAERSTISSIIDRQLSIAGNHCCYSNYYPDNESGLFYLKARFYSPVFAIFTSHDTYRVQNRFAYCNADPVNNSDPEGHMPGYHGKPITQIVLQVTNPWEINLLRKLNIIGRTDGRTVIVNLERKTFQDKEVTLALSQASHPTVHEGGVALPPPPREPSRNPVIVTDISSSPAASPKELDVSVSSPLMEAELEEDFSKVTDVKKDLPLYFQSAICPYHETKTGRQERSLEESGRILDAFIRRHFTS